MWLFLIVGELENYIWVSLKWRGGQNHPTYLSCCWGNQWFGAELRKHPHLYYSCEPTHVSRFGWREHLRETLIYTVYYVMFICLFIFQNLFIFIYISDISTCYICVYMYTHAYIHLTCKHIYTCVYIYINIYICNMYISYTYTQIHNIRYLGLNMVSCPIFLVSTETFSRWSLRFDLGPPPEVAPQLPQAEAWG